MMESNVSSNPPVGEGLGGNSNANHDTGELLPGDVGILSFSMEDAMQDDELLVQLVEACLFMHGNVTSEVEISRHLGIPLTRVHDALVELAGNYASFSTGLRVREVEKGHWIMDVKEVIEDSVKTFYIEKHPYTRSEIMTLATVAYQQPMPVHVLKFYRGSAGPAQARKWVSAGFLEEIKLPANDPALEPVLVKYLKDKADREVELASGDVPGNDEVDNMKVEDKDRVCNGKTNEGTKRTPRKKKAPSSYTCFRTTRRFAGYFDLPEDPDGIQERLETLLEVYECFE